MLAAQTELSLLQRNAAPSVGISEVACQYLQRSQGDLNRNYADSVFNLEGIVSLAFIFSNL